ncbi:MAG TPA: DUF6794 domain-containing protein [Ktedonobacterales bacterium]
MATPTPDDENESNADHRTDHKDWPQTVDEAVERLLQGMSEAEKQTVRSTPKDKLILFHRGWGMGIRNAFGMWQGNRALLASCAAWRGYGSIAFPDDASMVIIEEVWQRLQDEG